MLDACIDAPADFEGWRRLARAALQAGIPPEEVAWRAAVSPPDLQVSGVLRGHDGATVRVPPGFVDLARRVICHRSGERFALLYRLLWRITQGERALLEICTDPDVRRAGRMAQSVQRDQHKMKAFVRFRQIAGVRPEQFVAWFEPEHHVVDALAPFFCARFAGMRWSILTPERSVHWDGAALSFAAGRTPGERPGRRRARRPVAHLLCPHLQSRPAQGAGDARRDAGPVLAQPAGSARDWAPRARRPATDGGHD